MAGYELLRAAHNRDLAAALPVMIGRIGWTADALRSERRRGLRALATAAVARSPWHRDRLGHLGAVGSEPLLPDTRALLSATWGVPVENVYATTEVGGMAGTCADGLGLHLNDDLLVVEPVDEQGRPTPPGELSAKVYVTCLYNHDLPLVRYLIDDRIRVLPRPCSCGSAMRAIEDVHGRADDTFRYAGGVVAHPLVFTTVLGRAAQVAEYQVRQTDRGADVLVQAADADPDLTALRRDLEHGLGGVGVRNPQVTVQVAAAIPRLPTGKTRRFVPRTP